MNLVTSLYQRSPPLETPISHTELTVNPICGEKNKMRTLFFICCVVLILISCNPTDQTSEKVARKLTIDVATEIGHDFGEGGLYVQKTDDFLTLRSSSFTTSNRFPDRVRVLFANVATEYEGKIFRYPLTVGKTWEDTWNSTDKTTLEGYEKVEIALGTFPTCLKHKTVLTGAHIGSELEKALVNGTRYLWFAKGIGIVKVRYEHSNGIVTEAELINYKISGESEAYFPLNIDSTWTYQWKNDYYNEVFIETAHIGINHDTSEQFKGSFHLAVKVASESGEALGERNFYIAKTAASLELRAASSRPRIKSTKPILYPTSIFSDNISTSWPELFRFPLTVGKTWTEEGWSNSYLQTIIEDYEPVKCPAGDFQKCLKHKTIFIGAEADTELKSSLINGTRYLWFAKGVGLVKMRYEHANGVITEAELIEYNVPEKSRAYFPLNVDTTWTYQWHNDYQPKPIIEKLQVKDPKILPETPIKKASYVVTIEDPYDQAEMRVDYKLTPEDPNLAESPGDPNLAELQLRLNGDSDYIVQYNQYTPKNSESKPMDNPFSRSVRVEEPRPVGFPYFKDYPYPVWKIKFFKHKNKTPITLNYEISQRYAEDYKAFQTTRHGFATTNPRTQPYFREDCMLWSSGELFIVGGRTDNIEVEFKLPKGWRVLTPWKRIGLTGHRFSVENQEELTTNYLLIGEHTEIVAKSGKTEVVMGIGGHLKTSKDEMKRTVEKFLRAYSKLFKDGPDSRVTFILNPSEMEDTLGAEGQGRGRTVNILMNSTLNAASEHLWAPFLGHEVFHIWNGLTALEPFTSKERWFLEGVTNYYSDITAKQLGYLSESEYLERLESACEKYLSVSNEFAIGDDFRDSRLLYDGGSLVAASLDLQIRHLTKNRKNFNHVIQQMYRKFPDNSIEYTQRDIIRTVSKVAGKDFDRFFKTYVTGKQRLPLSEYFDKAGLNVQVTSEELPTADYVEEVLKASLQRDTGVEVTSINGSRIGSLKKLRKIAKHWKSAEAVTLSFEEKDKPVTVTATLKGVSDNPPTESEVVVRITKQAKPTKLQRAIFAGILGKR